jgi:hypothetical protein
MDIAHLPRAKVVVRDSELKVFYALCPYCYYPHKHGFDKDTDISGCTRGSHCGQGDYVVEGNLDFRVINVGLKRREEALQYKRKSRAKEKEKKQVNSTSEMSFEEFSTITNKVMGGFQPPLVGRGY